MAEKLSSEVNATTVLPAPSFTFENGWEYRKELTIDQSNVDADLTDYPATIHLSSDSDLADKAQSSGDDIRFEDGSGNQLSHEIESYDGTTGTLWAHVKIPSLSASSDTTIYLYYGNERASNQESVSDVWSNGYEAVYHLNESASGTGNVDVYRDSSPNNYHAVDHVSTSGQEGQIGDGQALDGQDDWIEISDTFGIFGGSTDYSVTAWAKHNNVSTGSNQQLICPGLDYQVELRENGDGNVVYGWWDGSTFAHGLDFPVSASSWYYASVTWNADGDVVLYKNGSEQDRTPTDSTPTLTGSASAIGQKGNGSNWLDGTVDEVRVSSVVRSAAWVAAAYANQSDPLAFCTVGSEQTSDNVSVNSTGNVDLWWIKNDDSSDGGFDVERRERYVDDGLVSHWTLDSVGDGTAGDIYGDHDGSVPDGVSSTTAQYNGGASFDGSSSIDVGQVSAIQDPGDSFTIATWVYPDDLSDWHSIFGSHNGDGYIFRTDSSGNLRLWPWGGGPTLSAGVWQHVAAVYDGPNNEVRLYVDGEETILPISSGFTPGSGIEIGGRGDGLDPWMGDMDEVFFYDRACSRSEIDYLRDNPSMRPNWADVVTGLSPSTTSYTDSSVSSGSTYEYRVERNTDHATATSAPSADIQTTLPLTIDGKGVIAMTIDGDDVTEITIDGSF